MAFIDSGIENSLASPVLQLYFVEGYWQETDQSIYNISLLRQVFGSIIDDTTQQGF